VGVAPRAEARAAAHVFVPDIQSAKEGDAGIDDDQFPVVAEIDLEAAPELTVVDERFDFDAFNAQSGGP
jgi:hypothetical protein